MTSLLEKLAMLKQADERLNPGRGDRNFLTETFVGAGPIGHYLKKNNVGLINEDDSHASANAKSAIMQNVPAGALYGAGLAGLLGVRNPAALAGAALAGGASMGALGSLSGGITGAFHDAYDESQAKNQGETLQKQADERLNPGRGDRHFLTESFIGAGPIGHYLKKNNVGLINEDDSHAAANAKVGLMQNGAIGALYGGGMAGLLGVKNPAARLGTALAAGASSGALGALSGGIVGSLHDGYDNGKQKEEERLNRAIQNQLTQKQAHLNYLEGLDKTASVTLHSLYN